MACARVTLVACVCIWICVCIFVFVLEQSFNEDGLMLRWLAPGWHWWLVRSGIPFIWAARAEKTQLDQTIFDQYKALFIHSSARNTTPFFCDIMQSHCTEACIMIFSGSNMILVDMICGDYLFQYLPWYFLIHSLWKVLRNINSGIWDPFGFTSLLLAV